MPMRPGLYPFGDTAPVVDERIGDAFSVVEMVHSALDEIGYVAANLEELLGMPGAVSALADLSPAIATNAALAQAAQTAAEAAAATTIAAQGTATTAAAAAAASATAAPNNAGLARLGTNAGGFSNGVLVGGADPGGYGMLLKADGHANWLTVMTSRNENPSEIGIYNSSGQGTATATAGSNVVTWVSGTLFTSAWIGKSFYLGGVRYRVDTVSDSTHLTVTDTAGVATTFPTTITAGTFHRFDTTCAGTCNVSGAVVTWVSGQKFIPFIDSFTVNGVVRTVQSFDSSTQITLTTSIGPLTGATFELTKNVNDQLSTLRIQKKYGATEENLSISARAASASGGGEYQIAGLSGTGNHYPIRFANGFVGASVQYLMTIHPGSTGLAGDGFVTLGGFDNAEAMRVVRQANVVNRVDVFGGPTTFGPSIRSRSSNTGTDPNVRLALDMQGTGDLYVTNGGFARTVFQAEASGSPTGWVGLLAGVATATVQAKGATNVDLVLTPKGTGNIKPSGLSNYANDAAAATGGVAIGGMYRNGSVLMVRVA